MRHDIIHDLGRIRHQVIQENAKSFLRSSNEGHFTVYFVFSQNFIQNLGHRSNNSNVWGLSQVHQPLWFSNKARLTLKTTVNSCGKQLAAGVSDTDSDCLVYMWIMLAG